MLNRASLYFERPDLQITRSASYLHIYHHRNDCCMPKQTFDMRNWMSLDFDSHDDMLSLSIWINLISRWIIALSTQPQIKLRMNATQETETTFFCFWWGNVFLVASNFSLQDPGECLIRLLAIPHRKEDQGGLGWPNMETFPIFGSKKVPDRNISPFMALSRLCDIFKVCYFTLVLCGFPFYAFISL